MTKEEKIELFVSLSKHDKANLTLLWLIDLIKTEHLTIEDVMDILNCVSPTFSKTDKFSSLLLGGTVSVSSISRLFGYGYAKSVSFINSLLKQKVIEKQDNCYKIIDKQKFKMVSRDFIKSD